MDQGGVESKDKECHKMVLYLPGTCVTRTREEKKGRTKNITRWLWIHLGLPEHGPGRSREPGQRKAQDGSVFTWEPRNMDQGGVVESEAKECRKRALYSPGAPVTWTSEDQEIGKRMYSPGTPVTWTRDE
jgi:hypothetical protein